MSLPVDAKLTLHRTLQQYMDTSYVANNGVHAIYCYWHWQCRGWQLFCSYGCCNSVVSSGETCTKMAIYVSYLIFVGTPKWPVAYSVPYLVNGDTGHEGHRLATHRAVPPATLSSLTQSTQSTLAYTPPMGIQGFIIYFTYHFLSPLLIRSPVVT